MSKRHFEPPATSQTGPGRSRRMSARQDNVRAAAAWVLERTLASMAPADSFLDSALPRFDDRDQGLLRELVMGTLRWLRRLDHVITAASSRSFDQIEEVLRSPLRVATYQLLFLDRVPAHAAVHEAVEQAHQLTHRGGASFVNGVLRRIARAPRPEDWPVAEADPVRRLAIEKSHPDFLVARWLDRFGTARTLDLLDANNRPKPMHLLAFRDRGGRELLAESLIDEGMEGGPGAARAVADRRGTGGGGGVALPPGPDRAAGQPPGLGGLPARRFLRAGRGEPGRRPDPAAATRGERARRRGGARRQELLAARLGADRPRHPERRRPGARRAGARQPAAAAARAAARRGRCRLPALPRSLRPCGARPAVYGHGHPAPAPRDQVADQRGGDRPAVAPGVAAPRRHRAARGARRPADRHHLLAGARGELGGDGTFFSNSS